MQVLPNELFTQATTTLLMPNVRSIGPLTMQQVIGTIPGPLPMGQSLLLVWPQVTALVAGSIVCFLLSYILCPLRVSTGLLHQIVTDEKSMVNGTVGRTPEPSLRWESGPYALFSAARRSMRFDIRRHRVTIGLDGAGRR